MTESSKKTLRKRHWRAFCGAALITTCLLLLGAGFLIADYNTRRTGQGEGSLRIEVIAQENALHVDVLGREQSIVLPEFLQEWGGRLWILLPPGARTLLWAYEGEREAVSHLADTWNG